MQTEMEHEKKDTDLFEGKGATYLTRRTSMLTPFASGDTDGEPGDVNKSKSDCLEGKDELNSEIGCFYCETSSRTARDGREDG